MTTPTLALTLWPEWAWAITNGQSWPSDLVPKLVENRSWHPGRKLPVGSRLAIHAGKYLGGRPSYGSRDEAIEGVGSMFRQANPDHWTPYPGWTHNLERCPKSAIVAVVTIDGYDQEQRTGWDVPGAWHWRLRDVVVLPEPVPCKGAQGLWALPDDVVAKLSAAGAP